MFTFIKSSYNKRNKCGSFLLNFNWIKLAYLFEILGTDDLLAIIEQTNGEVEYSSNLHQITHNNIALKIYRVGSNEYQTFENLVLNDKNAEIIIVEDNAKSENILLNMINDTDALINNYTLSNFVIYINRFESEISILLKEIQKEQFKKIKKLLK